MFVQKNLVLRISFAEVLQKSVSQHHDLPHLLITLKHQEKQDFFKQPITNMTWIQLHWFIIYLLVLDLQQVQHHSMGSHVFQQALLLHSALLTLIAQFREPLHDLKKRLNYSPTLFFIILLIRKSCQLKKNKSPLWLWCSCSPCWSQSEVCCPHPVLDSEQRPSRETTKEIIFKNRYYNPFQPPFLNIEKNMTK